MVQSMVQARRWGLYVGLWRVQAPSTLNFLRMQLDAALDGMYWWLGSGRPLMAPRIALVWSSIT